MTYSIVAKCQRTGEIGLAVQSHWFAVGREVLWCKPGIGAIVTQANVNPVYGETGLILLQHNISVQAALSCLLHDDAARDERQVTMMDFTGAIASHTGPGCIYHAGHLIGNLFCCQANVMLNEGVPSAMAQAFMGSSELPLAARLIAALTAAQDVGGDLRGTQSAALIVANANAKLVDVRVDDHPHPLVELARLTKCHQAYASMCPPDARPSAFLRPDCIDELEFWKDRTAPQRNPAFKELRLRMENNNFAAKD